MEGTSSFDNTIQIWDADTGVTLGKPLRGHTAGFVVRCVLSRWAAHHLWI